MAGVVFKCHGQPSMTHAHFARQAVPELQTWGGIVLNGFVGGINPTAVAGALDLGARIVWMPTMHARNHVREFGAESYGISPLTLSPGARMEAGLTVLDETGVLSAEAREMIDLASRSQVAVATGHLGEEGGPHRRRDPMPRRHDQGSAPTSKIASISTEKPRGSSNAPTAVRACRSATPPPRGRRAAAWTGSGPAATPAGCRRPA